MHYEIEGLFNHVFYAPIDEVAYKKLKKAKALSSDELIALTEDNPQYKTWFGGEPDAVTLTVSTGKKLTAKDLRSFIKESKPTGESSESLVTDFRTLDGKYFIIGHCVFSGTDRSTFKGDFAPSKLSVEIGRFMFGDKRVSDIEFLQIFYKNGDIDEGSSEDSREIMIWSKKDGITELEVV